MQLNIIEVKSITKNVTAYNLSSFICNKQYKRMEIIYTSVMIGMGIAIGIYISSQIEKHIDGRTNNKKLLKNMKEFDKDRFVKTNMTKKDILHYYTHIKKEKKDVN